MRRVLIKDAIRKTKLKPSEHINGWVHVKRDLGKKGFLIVKDRSGEIQVVMDLTAQLKDLFETINLGDIISLRGEARSDLRALGGVEIVPRKIKFISRCKHPSPLPLDHLGYRSPPSLKKRLDHRYLDLRNDSVAKIFKLRSEVIHSLRRHFRKRDFVEINTPKIVKEATEGGTNLFPIEYFTEDAFLAQSPQFYKQLMMASGLERVFEIGPAYRAERHETPWHLNEFTSVDIEMAFIDSEEEVMKVGESVLKDVQRDIKKYAERIGLKKDIEVPKIPFPRITVEEAYSLLENQGITVERGQDISSEGENALWEYFKEKDRNDFLFLTEFPADLRALYIMPHEKKPGYTRSFDLLYKGVEIITGGQRIHDYEMLKNAFERRKIDPNKFNFYINAFRYGMPPHGGFGLGLDRYLCRILDLENVREGVLFPRDRTRLAP